jgi:uncharacterized protein involved in exopolysaccharide biosynthesis
MAEAEFIPLDHIQKVFRLWWVVALTMILGGGLGFIFSRVNPPLYEAKAVFMASIDFNKIDFMHPPKPTPAPYELTQYDEDISLAMIEASLRTVMPQVVSYAQQNNIPLDLASLLQQSTVERAHAYWEVRVRNANPVFAQEIANTWAQLAFTDLKTRQSNGKLPVYIFFDLNQLATLPDHPNYFQTNGLVLAGCIIGLVAGILITNLLPVKKQGKNDPVKP